MGYIIVFAILFIAMLVYFKIADRYNIIDKPNHRSAHTEITLRGGGVIYPIAFLLFLGFLLFENKSPISPQNFLIFGAGLLAISTISFIDDIIDLSSKIRLFFHFIAVTLLLFFLQAFVNLPFWSIPILYILIIGILNAYNFMDGINGMSGLYSLVLLSSLYFIQNQIVAFTDLDFILFPLLASFVFLLFNFRKKAKCFMGDVGSLGIAFWIIGLIGLLVMKTGDFKYLLLFSVYGIEVVFTIVERIFYKENIFKAHRRHLYQLLANEKNISHLVVSIIYALVQILINIFIICTDFSWISLFLFVVIPISLIYLFIKEFIKKQISSRNLIKN